MSERLEDIPTGRTPRCRYCKQTVTEVRDPYSGVLDYGINGDFGCERNPINSDAGTGGHRPPNDGRVHRLVTYFVDVPEDNDNPKAWREYVAKQGGDMIRSKEI